MAVLMNTYKRWQTKEIKEALETRRVVLLSGARQCGKTTLAKELVSDDVAYMTLDDLASFEAAKLDPQSFVIHKEKTMIIDEVQRAPLLLIAIKKIVDEDSRPGQFLLTGSANINSIPTVKESLAGRISTIRLRTLSWGEIIGANPNFFDFAFKQDFHYPYEKFDKEKIIDIAFQGGFPEAILLEDRTRRRWHSDYVKALLDRDLYDISNIHKHDTVRQLLNVLAAWSGKFMDKQVISSSMSIRRETLDSYINALESLYLTQQVPAWHKTDYDRVGKRSKLYMTDSGLMSSLLSWRREDLKLKPDSLGKLIETFAFNELSTQVDTSGGEYELYHYRDREQREIDFLVERDDGAALGLEIKSSTVVTGDDFKHLNWFKKHVAKDRTFIGIVLYTGLHPLRFGQDMWAIPFSMVWPKNPL